MKEFASVIGKPNSMTKALVKRKFVAQKEQQIQDVVQWVHVHSGSYVRQMGIEGDHH